MISQVFQIQCKGRDKEGSEVLENPVRVEVLVFQVENSNSIFSNVKCEFNTGAKHGHRCKASHQKGVDKVGEDVNCPYWFDIPDALEK